MPVPVPVTTMRFKAVPLVGRVWKSKASIGVRPGQPDAIGMAEVRPLPCDRRVRRDVVRCEWLRAEDVGASICGSLQDEAQGVDVALDMNVGMPRRDGQTQAGRSRGH